MFVPGMFPGSRGTAGLPLTTLSLAYSAVAPFEVGNAVLTVPAGVRAGDLLFYWCRCSGSSAPVVTVPAGWTFILSRFPTGTVRQGVMAMCKIADGSEAGVAFTGGMIGNLTNTRHMAVLRGDQLVSTITIGGVASEYNNGISGANPSAQTVPLVASGATPPVVVFATYFAFRADGSGGSGNISPRSFDVAGIDAKTFEFKSIYHDVGDDVDVEHMWTAGKVYSAGAALSDPVIDMQDEGDDLYLTSCYIICS